MTNGEINQAFWKWAEETYSPEDVEILRGYTDIEGSAQWDYFLRNVYVAPTGEPLPLSRPQAEKFGIDEGFWDVAMNVVKKLFRGVGIGGFYVGYGAFAILFSIVQFAIPAIAGLSMIWWAITLFLEGSILWGLLVLLIGTPIAIGIAAYAAIFLFFMGIIALITWGIMSLFGIDVSFASVWGMVWFGIKILVLGGIAFVVGSSFVEAVKGNGLMSFVKGNWFWIILFFFLLWLFF